MENSEVDLPKGMIERNWKTRGSTFLMPSQIPAEDSGEDSCNAKANPRKTSTKNGGRRPNKRLKTRLLVNKIIEEEKGIEVADNEIDEEIKKQAEANMVSRRRNNILRPTTWNTLKNDIKTVKSSIFSSKTPKSKKGKRLNSWTYAR